MLIEARDKAEKASEWRARLFRFVEEHQQAKLLLILHWPSVRPPLALPSSPSLDLLPLTSSVDPPVISPPRVRSDRRQARSLIEASMTRHVKRLRLAVAADRLAAADQHDAGVGPEESQVIAADCRGSPLSPKRHRWSAADSH